MPAGSIMFGEGSFSMLDLQNPIRMHQQQHPRQPFHHQQHQNPTNPQIQVSMLHPPMHDVFPFTGERAKTLNSKEDEPSFNTEEGANGHNETGKGKKVSPWQRVKWSDQMVRLLITAVSYLGEDAAADCGSGGRRKVAILQKKGKWKWKSISKALAERACYVSP